MSLTAKTSALMERIRKARAEHRTVQSNGAELDLEHAYRIQAALGKEQELKGYKLDFVATGKHEQRSLDVQIYGHVYSEMLLASPVRLSRFVQPRLEPELAVVLGGAVPADAEPAHAYLAIGGVFLAIDFLDSIWEEQTPSVADLVADNASGGGFLLGERLLDPQLEGTLSLCLNGDLLTDAPLAALGDPSERLAWLATAVGGLREGQVVFLGLPAAAHEARPGTLELRGPDGSLLIAKLEE